MANGRDDRPTAVERLTENDIRLMLIGVKSSRPLWQYLATHITAADFTVREYIYAALWSALNRCWSSYDGITYELLVWSMGEALRSHGVAVPNDVSQQLFGPGGFLQQLAAYNAPDAELNRAAEIAKAFLAERCVVDRLQRVVQHTPQGLVPGQFGDAVRSAVDVYERTTANPLSPNGQVVWSVSDVLATARSSDAVTAQPTGLWFVDEINGGQRTQEVNGVLGLSGHGKSTFATQLLASLAKRQPLLPESQRRLQVYVTYEQPPSEIVGKYLSAAAFVREQVAECVASGIANPGWTSSATGLLDYDAEATTKAFPGSTQAIGERERIGICLPIIDKYTAVIDQRASKNGGDAMPGGLTRTLQALQNQYGLPIGTVIIDYAGQACELQIANGKRYIADAGSAMASLLKQYSSECQSHIADPFNAAVWVLHQLNPLLASAGPGKLMVHQDAAYCRAFAEHQVSCACLGVADKKQGVATLNWSKIRKTHVGSEPYTIISKHKQANVYERAQGFKVHMRGRRTEIASVRIEHRISEVGIPTDSDNLSDVVGDASGRLPGTDL